MKHLLLWSIVCSCAAAFAGSGPEEDFVRIPANPDFVFARDLQSHGPRGESGEKSPIPKAYRMAKYPVTNAEYADFCRETGHRTPRYWKNGTFPAGKDKHPVLDVSVDDVDDYCRYLEKKHPGWRFRLPTEAEWENAARGPDKNSFPWGNSDRVGMKNGVIASPFNFNAVIASHYLKESPDMKVVFFHQRSARKGESEKLRELISVNERGQVRGWINHNDHTGFVYTDLFRKLSDEGGYTTPVDQYPDGKSPYGCFDMAGNSWDWTGSEITATNGAERGKTVNAIRGGSWYANKSSCRTDYRGEGRCAQGCYNTVGFRLVAEREGDITEPDDISSPDRRDPPPDRADPPPKRPDSASSSNRRGPPPKRSDSASSSDQGKTKIKTRKKSSKGKRKKQ